jgi:hypothetical protein
MAQYIVITKKRIYQVEARSLAHVTQACHAIKLKPISVTELNEENN